MSIKENMQQQIESYLEENRPRYLQSIRQLAQIPAPSNHEEKRAEWCKQYLESLGATGVYIDSALNVIFPYGVKEGDSDLCAILAHTDVTTICVCCTPASANRAVRITTCRWRRKPSVRWSIMSSPSRKACA